MFANPETILSQLNVKPGMHVADLGAGSGFYALAAARLVGHKGKVYAVEVKKALLDRVKNNATRENLHNLEVVWGDVESHGGTRLRDGTMDKAIISNTLFQIEDKEKFAREAARILKSGGEALIVDWSDSSDISGPDPKHVVAKADAQALFERAGLHFSREISAGSHHYGIVMVK